ncbi:hypothetical protein AYI70_g1260 [Smittium culicis]|uniref:Uncharacterized protein n=1 Tax=Smittium culicis TaxID=133412 RepID=A0A1R1YDD4_9FUNG|nr:hypothetical protein AYI70_g1260 [Smittium culicis]
MVTKTSNDIALGRETVYSSTEAPPISEREIQELDFINEPNHSKNRHFNLKSNISFTERILFKSIQSKNPKSNVEGISVLHFNHCILINWS